MMKSKYDFPLINGFNSDKLNLIIKDEIQKTKQVWGIAQ